MIKITIDGDSARIESPYNPDFVNRVKKMGGKWSAEGKVWIVDARNVEAVRVAMREVYGMDDMPTDLVSVRVTCSKPVLVWHGPVVVFGRIVASARGRDSGARIGEGVAFLKGRAKSGGSVKNWETIVEADSEIIIHDVPRTAVEEGLGVYEGMEYEILEPPTNGRREQLEKEKACLLARLAEIEKELEGLA